jgi:hypothetical protein
MATLETWCAVVIFCARAKSRESGTDDNRGRPCRSASDASCYRSRDQLADLPDCRGGALHKAAWSVDAGSGGRGGGSDRCVTGLCHNAWPRHALSWHSSQQERQGAGNLAERRAALGPIRHPACHSLAMPNISWSEARLVCAADRRRTTTRCGLVRSADVTYPNSESAEHALSEGSTNISTRSMASPIAETAMTRPPYRRRFAFVRGLPLE